MADLDPDDIKDEDETLTTSPQFQTQKAATAEPHESALDYLCTAVAELARAAGSPPAVTAALDKARAALGK